mgnify:CR=1 FL=1
MSKRVKRFDNTHFKQYFLSLEVDKRPAFARKCGSSTNHLANVAFGQKKVSPRLAIDIEKATDGKVRVEQLVPQKSRMAPKGTDWAYLRGTAKVSTSVAGCSSDA